MVNSLGVSVHLQRMVVNFNVNRIKLYCKLSMLSKCINGTRINSY